MNIRLANPSDLPELVSLRREVHSLHAQALPDRFRADTPDEEFADSIRRVIDSPSSCLLICGDDEVRGFLSADFRDREANWCTPARRVCYLSEIVVSPRFRRRGVARELFEALGIEVARRKAASIELEVWNFNNEAREAFHRMGFQPLFERMVFRPAQNSPDSGDVDPPSP